MKLRIEGYSLDTEMRTLSSAQGTQPIRPKTLALLLYLIEHKSDIVSKTRLLDEVWDDVSVNEGVIFQSIREIRQLFSEMVVIQNHPRKGYQWIAHVSSCSESELDPQKLTIAITSKNDNWQSIVLFVFAILCVIPIAIFSWLQRADDVHTQLLVLPIQSFIDRNDHDWLSADAAKQLIRLLTNVSPDAKIALSEKKDVTPISADPLTWRLSVSMYGDVYDYKLLYRLSNSKREHRGVIFSHAVEQAFELLAKQVSVTLFNKVSISTEPHPDVHTDMQFHQAMRVYETDWSLAVQILQGYLQSYPNSARGALYLSRLYIWQQQHEAARELLETALALPNVIEHVKSELLYNLALIQQQQPPQALATIARALPQTEKPQAWFTRAKLAELAADIHYQQNQLVEALRRYILAESLYDQIQLPVNGAGIKLKIAALYIGKGDLKMARKSYQQAKDLIQEKEMSFLYAALTEFEMRHQALLN